MARILPLPTKPAEKLGFRRARRRKKPDPELLGQLNLFEPPGGKILPMPSRRSVFEQALSLDERGDRKARELYRRAIELETDAADAYCNLGILECRAGRTEKAFDCFTRALQIEPRHLEAHYNLANLYFDLENLVLAKEHYRFAAEIDPDFADVYFNLGLVLTFNQEFEAARDAFEEYKRRVSPAEGQKADEWLERLRQALAAQQ